MGMNLEARSVKKGTRKNDIFWSETGPEFGEPSPTPQPAKLLRRNPPLPPFPHCSQVFRHQPVKSVGLYFFGVTIFFKLFTYFSELYLYPVSNLQLARA